MRSLSSTRNSASLRLGSTCVAAKCPRSALVILPGLRVPEPSWRAIYPSLSRLRCATTWQLARRSTVTGTCSPASVNTRVMPTFWATTPERIANPIPALQFDLDVNAGSEVELHQRVHRLRCWIDDVQETLVRAHLELFAALLVDVRRAVDRKLLDLGRQRNRATDLRTGALGRVHDLARRRIEDAVIERLEPDPYILAVHFRFFRPSCPPVGRATTECLTYLKMRMAGDWPGHHASIRYSMMLATTPAPTVRPPSRMAKRSFSSMAMGTIRCTSIATLSPGITISVPCGRCTTPVTSVVRK